MPSLSTQFLTKNPLSLIHFPVFILLLFFSGLSAQRPLYQISVTLDPSRAELNGTINITYTNNSNVKLDKLGIHLWPNAYKERNTALVKQKLHQDDLTLYRARREDLGGIDQLNFKSSDQSIELIADKENIDIGWIKLSEPLSPGATIHISSPFRVKIPKSFSRM